jgi:hypothetical protein
MNARRPMDSTEALAEALERAREDAETAGLSKPYDLALMTETRLRALGFRIQRIPAGASR